MTPLLPELSLVAPRISAALGEDVPTAPDRLRYVLVPGPRGRLECRFGFPGDEVARVVGLGTRKRLEILLRQPFLEAEDRRLLMRLYMGASRGGGAPVLSGGDGFLLLRDLVGTGRSRLGTVAGRALRWEVCCPMSGKVRPGWRTVEGGMRQPVLRAGDETGEVIEVAGTCPLVGIGNDGGWVAPMSGVEAGPGLEWLRQEPLGAVEAGAWFRAFAERHPESGFPEPPPVVVRVSGRERPRPVLDLDPGASRMFGVVPGERVWAGRLWFLYRGTGCDAGTAGTVVRIVEGADVVEIPRDAAAEEAAERELREAGLIHEAGTGWMPPEGPGGWHGFLRERQGELEAAGWTVRWDGTREVRALADEALEVRLRGDGEDPGLLLGIHLRTGQPGEGDGLEVSAWLHDVLRQWQGKPLGVIRERLRSAALGLPVGRGVTGVVSGERLAELAETVFELHDPDPFQGREQLRLSPLRAAEVIRGLGLDEEAGAALPAEVWRMAEVLREGFAAAPGDEPSGLRAALRDYQKAGVGWLQALSAAGWNGILADDMGLGKTLQTIAHLLHEKAAGRLERAALLVVPTSLLGNWRNELARFAPGLTVITLHGEGRRTQFRVIPDADVVVTTYGLVQRDEVWHREQHYGWIVLDEAQSIKNPASRMARVLGRLRSDRRLCLTGTPVENHLGELWSLFEFLVPGYLGDRETFRRRFRKPIEQEGSETMREILARRTRPFLLRRRKRDVVRELPPKTQLLRPVELTARQREVYEDVREAMQIKVRNEIAEKGLTRSKFVILEALTRLRQVCCDPRLAKRGDTTLKASHSAKLAALMEMLPDWVRDDHRVLVFSQFTSMLTLIQEELRAARIGHVILTGSTVDRERPVTAFQAGKVPVFLISLRAGGAGLNLTAADTVVHYDPWWNPQVENQATDRAYRIGQGRPVFVHKFVAAETVEEKIVAMQERKAALAEGILRGAEADGGGEEPALDITEADVEEWFGPV